MWEGQAVLKILGQDKKIVKNGVAYLSRLEGLKILASNLDVLQMRKSDASTSRPSRNRCLAKDLSAF